jgi:DNA-3-methyladenine glycosylase II
MDSARRNSVAIKKALLHLEAADPALAALIANIGPYRITYHAPDFTTLARSILSQQLSGKAADTIVHRLLTAAEAPDGRLSPARLSALGPEGLRPLGLSRQKAAALLHLASHPIPYPQLPRLSDDEVIAILTAVKGIGVWTAHMFLLFALRRPDVLPTGDLGIRNAIHRAYRLPAPPTPAEILALAQPWRPYASFASWYLWRSLDGPGKL